MKTITRSNRMRHLGTVALMLSLGVAAVYAQQPVKMTFSGTSGASAIDLKQPNAGTGEDNFAGNGTLGQFTFRNIFAENKYPQQPPSTCSGPAQFYFLRVSGAGVLRFQDGSLLKVNMTQGDDCVDLAAQQGHCTVTFQITGGTGRFKDASGVLTLTETVLPVLADASSLPVFFASTGELTGTVSRVAAEEKHQDDWR
jgi:hypothetical protein